MEPLHLYYFCGLQKQQAQGQVCVEVLRPNTSQVGIQCPPCMAPSQVCPGSCCAHHVPETFFVSLQLLQLRKLEAMRSGAAVALSSICL